jgi:hypothetical protein
MLAIGCLIPVVLLIGGALAGAGLGGSRDAAIGAGVGLISGLVIMAALLWGWERIRTRF